MKKIGVRDSNSWFRAGWSLLSILLFALFAQSAFGNEQAGERRVINLNGSWQIAEGGSENIPTIFDRTVPVPGLVSLAQPPFVAPGPKVTDRQSVSQKDPRRDAFWYRRIFHIDRP